MGKDRFTSIALVSLSLLLVAGSIFFLFAIEPERDRISSNDDVVTIEGFTRSSQPFQIETLPPVFIGSVYRIKPSDSLLETPATVSFALAQSDDAAPQTIFRFDEDFDMWETVSPIVQRSPDRIVAEVDRLGLFTLGKAREITSANFLADRDELLAMAPENTVGFELAIGMDQDSHVIKLDDSTSIGGCAGIVEHGNGVEESRIDRDARVYIDDVETQVKLIFAARWFLNEHGGCGEGEHLEAK